MTIPGTRRTAALTGLLAALAVAGCTTFPWSPAPPPTIPAPAPQAPVGPVPAAGPIAVAKGTVVPAAHHEPGNPNDQLSLLMQQLAEAKDDRKVLLARLKMVEDLLREKEQLLAESAQEVKAARAELEKNQAEMKRWRNEIVVLRHQLESIETDNVQTLRDVVRILEQLLHRRDTTGPHLE